MHPVGVGYSDVGREREQNEDSFYADDERGLYIVADGMGGHASGEVASATAIACVSRAIGQHAKELLGMRQGAIDMDRVATIVREAVQGACAEIYDKAQTNPAHAGMGSTLTMLLVIGARAVMAHVGDTRLYLCRERRASQLSSDHTMAAELLQAGLIEENELMHHQYSHVLSRALGPQRNVRVDTLVIDITPSDRFLLCSDGLHEYLEDESWLARELRAVDDLDEVAEELVAFANTAGGHDNITAVVVEVRPDEPEIEIVDEMSVDLQHRFDALGGVFIFEGLSLALLARVLSHCEINDYEAGAVVMTEGQPCDQLMVVLDGIFIVSHDGNADGFFVRGEHAAATTLLAPRGARATLTAREPSRLLILRRKPFWKLIRQRPWLGVGLLERLGRQLSLDLDRSIERRDDGDPSTTPVDPHERI
jgi:serine/threonine protein phosphatase PrpC